MNIKKPYHVNDATLKYSSLAFRKRQHQYLKLPGEYIRRYPTEVVLPNMETGRMDELYLVKLKNGKMLINLEEETEIITDETLKKFGKYKTFGSFIYGWPFLTAVLCLKDPQDFPKEYKRSPTDITRPIYIFFNEKDLKEKYKNLIKNINQNNILSDDEALSIAFIPKYISNEYAPAICESLARVFENAIIPDKALKRDVAIILMTMILKHVKGTEKQNKLIGMMNMKEYEDEIDEIINNKYGETLTKKDQEIHELTEKLTNSDIKLAKTDEKLTKIKKEYKSKIEKLNAMDDLNSPQAKKILNSLLVLLN